MPGVLCEHCTAVCCKYIALPLDRPESRSDFDDIRWFLMHENISVFVEDGDWYISMATPCRHLQPDHRCGVYETRPNICRKYSTDNCDYHSGDYGWELHFTCAEHLDDYLRNTPPDSGRAKRRKRQKSRLGVSLRDARRGRRKRLVDSISGSVRDIRGVPLPVLGLVPGGEPGSNGHAG